MKLGCFMPILHMETDAVGEVAQGVALLAGLVSEEGSTMRRAVWRLVNSWQGGAAADFEWEANHLLTTLSRLEEEAALLSQRLRREIEEWEDVDRQLSGSPGIALPIWSPTPFPYTERYAYDAANVTPPHETASPPLSDLHSANKPGISPVTPNDTNSTIETDAGTATPPIISSDHPAANPPHKPTSNRNKPTH